MGESVTQDAREGGGERDQAFASVLEHRDRVDGERADDRALLVVVAHRIEPDVVSPDENRHALTHERAGDVVGRARELLEEVPLTRLQFLRHRQEESVLFHHQDREGLGVPHELHQLPNVIRCPNGPVGTTHLAPPNARRACGLQTTYTASLTYMLPTTELKPRQYKNGRLMGRPSENFSLSLYFLDCDLYINTFDQNFTDPFSNPLCCNLLLYLIYGAQDNFA